MFSDGSAMHVDSDVEDQSVDCVETPPPTYSSAEEEVVYVSTKKAKKPRKPTPISSESEDEAAGQMSTLSLLSTSTVFC